jgi:hypothetical protein
VGETLRIRVTTSVMNANAFSELKTSGRDASGPGSARSASANSAGGQNVDDEKNGADVTMVKIATQANPNLSPLACAKFSRIYRWFS